MVRGAAILFCCTPAANKQTNMPETPFLMPLLAGLGPALVEQLGSKVSASLSGLKERLEAVGGAKGRVVASLLSPLQGTASESTTCCCCWFCCPVLALPPASQQALCGCPVSEPSLACCAVSLCDYLSTCLPLCVLLQRACWPACQPCVRRLRPPSPASLGCCWTTPR